MDPNKRVNEFLPPSSSASATPADRMDAPMEDDFDVAQYRALKKDKQEEQKRLDHEHDLRHRHLEEQVHQENSRLYAQLQQRVNESIQRAFIDLQPAIAATINSQVSLRLEQQRLRDEHAASRNTIEQRYHNKITSLMAMPSAARTAIPRVNSNSSTPSHPPPNNIRMASTGGTPATPAFNSPALQHASTPTPSRGPPPQEPPRPEHMTHQMQQQQQPQQAQQPPPPPPQQQQQQQQRMPPRAEAPPHHHQQPVAPQRILPSEPLNRQPVAAPPQRMPLPESMPQQQQPMIQQRMPPDAVHQRPLPHHHMPPEPHPREPRHQLPSMAQPQPQPLASDTKPETLRQSVPPLPSSNPVLASRGSQESVLTPRQDVKRKAADSPAMDAANSALKRPRTRDRPFEQGQDGPSPVKRSPRAHRPAQVPPVGMEKRVQRTISFAEVYQDGKAQFKHQIFEYKAGSGNWYIVKCDEHGVHFKFGNPVHGAAKHVHSPQHDMQPKTHDLAIEICGYLVTDCNAELAKLNNDEYQRAVAQDGYEPYNRNLLTKEGRQRTDNHKKQPKTEREGGEIHVNGDGATPRQYKPREPKPATGITPIKDCHFYQGLWQSNKKWYSLVVLPIRPDGSLREVGLKERFQELPLMQTVPKCYRVDRVSLMIKGWQPAYEDGEAKAKKREYPVMFFDRTPWSLGWLPAQKLQELDLDNPPQGVDVSGLRKAREWFAVKMNNRASWDELKRLGPGEPLSATPEGEADWIGEQGLSLRSADKPDDKSPTFFDKHHGKSPGCRDSPGSGDDSDDDSDEVEEDPMKMDIGPIPDPGAGDSNWVEGSDSEMDIDDEPRPKRGSHDGKDEPTVEAKTNGTKTTDELAKEESNREAAQKEEPRNEAGLSNILSEHERVRKSAQTAQAKAAAAVREAASRSRAASEVADDGPKPSETEPKPPAPVRADTDAGPRPPQRPTLADHQRSRSDGTFPEQSGLAAPGMGKVGEGRKHSNLQNILNPAGMRADGPPTENGLDSYKRFDALMAQRSNDTTPLRPASVPVQTNGHHFQPPTQPTKQMDAVHHSPSLSHILSPPMQSPLMAPPRSASTTPVPDGSGRSTPTIMIPNGGDHRWQAVRTSLGPAPPGRTSSFTAHGGADGQKQQPTTPTVTVRAETPVSGGAERKEIFDVSQFRDSGRGVRWSRSSSPTAGYLRLATDPVRGVAEAVDAPEAEAVPAGIEPAKVSRIELETDRDRQWVQLVLKDRSEQALAFETNSASGRLLNAKIQGRRFVSWVRKWNPDAELSSGEGSSRRSSVTDDRRRSTTAEAH